MTNNQEKHLNILLRLSFDPKYVKKAKQSICKDCMSNLGFSGEYYDCVHENFVKVKYKQEGLFHTQIIECDGFVEMKSNE